jgi:hypothetical protein
MQPVRANGVLLRSAVCLLMLGAAGCSHLHWPGHKPPPPPPKAVHYLDVGGSNAAASGSGSITLRPPAEGWPVRVALRVTPGTVGELDVRGAERVVLPIVPMSGKPVDLELAPGVYPPKTAEVTVAWGPFAAPAT